MASHSVVATRSGRLDAVLAAQLAESRSRITAWIRQGAVQVDGLCVTRPAKMIGQGARVDVQIPEAQEGVALAQDLPLSVVYQDQDLAIIDKAAGMVVHPGAGHHDGTLVNALLHHLGDLSGIGGVLRPGIVHRLDRGTSGLMVVAKNDTAHAHLSAQFADHSAGRTYLAICHGVPERIEGTIRSMLARHPRDRIRFASTGDDTGKRAVTHFRRVDHHAGNSLIRCRLETGRTHQVRIHLTEQGWPLVGDPLYGRRKLSALLAPLVPEGRPMLHAFELRLRHPADNLERVFHTSPPADFAAVCNALNLDYSGQV